MSSQFEIVEMVYSVSKTEIENRNRAASNKIGVGKHTLTHTNTHTYN